jgi:hypothetical protein
LRGNIWKREQKQEEKCERRSTKKEKSRKKLSYHKKYIKGAKRQKRRMRSKYWQIKGKGKISFSEGDS